MLRKFQQARTQRRNAAKTQRIAHTAAIALFGLLSGIFIKLLDIYTTNLGNIFSQLSVWILLCTIIAVYSGSPVRASLNVFLFCAGMILTYYLTAVLADSYYSLSFVYGWCVFTLFTPVFAYFTWYAKGKGLLSRLITAAIILIMMTAAVVLFDKIRLSDIIIAIATVIALQFDFTSLLNRIFEKCKSDSKMEN